MVKEKKGIILAEVIVGFFVFGIVCFMMLQLIFSLISMTNNFYVSEFDVAIKQVTWQISTSNSLYRQENDYCFDYQDSQRCLIIKNNRLYLTPGTQIVLNNYEYLYLFEKDGQLAIIATKKGRVYEAIIYDIQP